MVTRRRIEEGVEHIERMFLRRSVAKRAKIKRRLSSSACGSATSMVNQVL